MRPGPDAEPTRRFPVPGSSKTASGSPAGALQVQPGVKTPPPTYKPVANRKRWTAKRVLLVVAVVFAVYLAALATVFATSVNKVGALPPSTVSSFGTNFLLVGSDSRQGLSARQQRRLNTGSTEGQRTDTIMIMHVPWLGLPTLISLPRDSWVGIPGYGSNKLNAAYSIGGPRLLARTVEEATGLQIDHFVEIGFGGIATTTNALGGVTLCPKQDYNDLNSGLNVSEGCQTMKGKNALAYVRMRYADSQGDLGRVQRQQEYMSAVAKKAMSPTTWLVPWRAFDVARSAGSSLTVDSGTGVIDDARLALAMGMISVGLGESTTVPTVEGTYWADGQAAVKWDTPKALELFNSVD